MRKIKKLPPLPSICSIAVYFCRFLCTNQPRTSFSLANYVTFLTLAESIPGLPAVLKRGLMTGFSQFWYRFLQWLTLIAALPPAKKLGSVDESALMIDPPIDEIRVVERQFGGTVDDGICSFDAEHEGVILIADLVSPAAEAAAGEDVFLLQAGEELFQHAFTLQRRGRVAVLEAAVVFADDFVGGVEEFGGDEAAEGFFDNGLVIDGFER